MKRGVAAKRRMATAMRLACYKEGKVKGGKGDGNDSKGIKQGTAMATKRAMATATRVAGNKEGNGDSNKSDGL
jgi:hypothetical protein